MRATHRSTALAEVMIWSAQRRYPRHGHAVGDADTEPALPDMAAENQGVPCRHAHECTCRHAHAPHTRAHSLCAWLQTRSKADLQIHAHTHARTCARTHARTHALARMHCATHNVCRHVYRQKCVWTCSRESCRSARSTHSGGMRRDLCIDLWIDMCIHMCIDMCVDMCIDRHV